MSELNELSYTDLRSGLDNKKFSSVELIKSCIKRAEKVKDLNCFIELAPEASIKAAEEADKVIAQGVRTPLLGIPVGIKDVILTKGIATSAASKILKGFIPPYDATVVRKLKSQGAVPFGKLNMDEFAMGSSTENSSFGPVKNPWNPEYVPGGSSGGSAAAVAAEICPMTLGTDTGGSIRQPASLCGIVGLKPTYGRVSRYGVVAFASSLDQVGGFARDVTECAHLTEAIAGYDPNDSTSVEKPALNLDAALKKGIKGLRIGVPKEYWISGLDPEVEKSVRDALKVLEGLGAKLVDVSLPNTDHAVAVYYIIAPAEASSNLARYDGVRYGHRTESAKDLMEMYSNSRSEGFGSEVQRRIMVGTYVLSSGYYDAYYLKAQKVRTLIKNDFTKVFESDCDVIVSPTTPTAAFKLGEKFSNPLMMYLNDIFTIPVNLAGLPGMSLPCGLSSNNLPLGLQLIGKPWDEAGLISVAYAYEQATDWHKHKAKI